MTLRLGTRSKVHPMSPFVQLKTLDTFLILTNSINNTKIVIHRPIIILKISLTTETFFCFSISSNSPASGLFIAPIKEKSIPPITHSKKAPNKKKIETKTTSGISVYLLHIFNNQFKYYSFFFFSVLSDFLPGGRNKDPPKPPDIPMYQASALNGTDTLTV